jgi:hypothetical protein
MSAQAVVLCGRDLSAMATARKTWLNIVFMDKQPSHDTTDQQRDKENYNNMKDPS